MKKVPALPQPGLRGVHDADKCVGRHCVIHNPSDHHMVDWPMNWRTDRYLMERICPHGIGHPDPDHMTFITRYGTNEADGVHGCDGCCSTNNSNEIQEDS